jgi:hypothetical protein
MNLFERHYYKSIYNAVYSQIESFLEDLRIHGPEQARRNMDQIILNEQIAKPVQQLYVGIGSYFADKTLAGLKAEEKGFGINIDWVQKILNYINSTLLSKVIIPITETTKDQIIKILTGAQEKGWGYDKIASQLKELPKWRARLIVRTESVQAMFIGSQLGEDESPFESYKVWISANDLRTRHSHRVMDGKVTTDKFVVPRMKDIGKVEVQVGVDLMDGPGDPKAHIENLANCRCTMVNRLRRDENGRLIRKQQYRIR